MKTKYNATDRIPRRIVTPTLLLAGEILIQIPKSPSINNDNGLGLDDYMNFVNAEYNNMQLSKVIDNQIVTILEELNNYNNPLSDEIMNNKDDLLNSYEELQKLVPFIKVDMTSGLGVLITYQDNDGD